MLFAVSLSEEKSGAVSARPPRDFQTFGAMDSSRPNGPRATLLDVCFYGFAVFFLLWEIRPGGGGSDPNNFERERKAGLERGSG